METPILRVENLIVTKKANKNNFTLNITQLEFYSGKIYSLVGPNGAGKTTLLNLISFLEPPDEGKIFFNGIEINNPASRLNIRRKIGIVMENPILFHTTVFNNIALALKFRGIDKKKWYPLTEEALKMVGLEWSIKRYPTALSRGEIQRVAIARALVSNPEILLLDEPFTNIDKNSVEVIENLIKRVNATVIFTTHDFTQAYRLADEVISILDGKIVPHSLENLFSGEIEEINGTKFVKIAPSIKIAVVTEKSGRVRVSIAPQDIILSHNQLQSSARNSFQGIINKIQLQGEVVKVFIDAGVEFIALITMNSYNSMQLSVGAKIFLTFKSTSVKVI